MRIAYCEDETIQLEYMKRLIGQWQEMRNAACSVSLYRSGEEMLFENPDYMPFDLILLDVEMGGINGMELAKRIRKKDRNVPLIFLTNRREYVFEGYEVQALRYLMKPIGEETLFLLLDEAAAGLFTKREYLMVRSGGESRKVDLDEIFFIEAMGHYVKLWLETESLEVKQNINRLAQELEGRGFVAAHRSFLINLKHAARLKKAECILDDGRRVPVSRSAYRMVNESFLNYYRRQSP